MLTPAQCAELETLEREFRDLLNAPSRSLIRQARFALACIIG
jgi:hypothetical protein